MSCFAFYPLGVKGVADELPLLNGKLVEFQDVDYTNARPETRKLISGRSIWAIRVLNDGSGTLAAGTVVKWKAGKEGYAVSAVTGSGEVGCGVIDPYISSAVAIGESVWLIIRGPIRVTAGAAITAGVQIIPAGSGKVITATDNVAGVRATCGRAVTAAAADGDVISAFVNFPV